MSLITKTPGVCGGRACIAGRRLEVSLLAKYIRDGWTDDEIINTFYLSRAELKAVQRYMRTHVDETNDDDDGEGKA